MSHQDTESATEEQRKIFIRYVAVFAVPKIHKPRDKDTVTRLEELGAQRAIAKITLALTEFCGAKFPSEMMAMARGNLDDAGASLPGGIAERAENISRGQLRALVEAVKHAGKDIKPHMARLQGIEFDPDLGEFTAFSGLERRMSGMFDSIEQEQKRVAEAFASLVDELDGKHQFKLPSMLRATPEVSETHGEHARPRWCVPGWVFASHESLLQQRAELVSPFYNTLACTL